MFQSGVKSDKSCKFAIGSRTHAEQGRGMVEMLGVLAVIGVLTVGGILGYRYAMNKSRANDVLNYVRIGHTIISAMNGVPTKATPNDLEELKYPSTDLPYYYGDETAFYIGMPAIEKGVCKLIPDMIASPIIGVYTIDGEALTPDKCTDNIELEYAFEWGDNQELECLLDCGDHGKPDSKCLACDCMPHFAGDYCDECAGGWQTEEGSAIQCGECPEPFTQQGDTCGCTVQGCDAFNTTTDCSCAKCSTEFNYELKQPVNENGDTCEPDEEGGTCGWLCEAKEGNACSFNFENSNPELEDILPPVCSFKYVNSNPELEDILPPFCSFKYVNPDTTSGSTVQIEAHEDCPTGQYCYLRWNKLSETGCSGTAVGEAPENGSLIYGTCHDTGTYSAGCSIGKKASMVNIEAHEDCPTGQYCYLRWNKLSETGCSGTAVGEAPENGSLIYGTCHDTGTYSASCSIGKKASAAIIWPEKKCPAHQYCYLKWLKEDCSQNVDEIGGSEIFGACRKTSSYSAPTTCPIQK